MDEQRTHDRPGGDGSPQIVRIRTDEPGTVPITEDRATRRLGRLPQHAQGQYDLAGPEPRRAPSRLVPLLLTTLGTAALVWGGLVLGGIV